MGVQRVGAAFAAFAAVMLGLLAWLSTAAHAETRPPYGGTIKASLLGEPVTLDPVDARTHAEITLVSLVFDTLYRPSTASVTGAGTGSAHGAARVVPHVAAGLPAVSANGLEVRITIRRGITFHDNEPLGADDVAASLRRLARSQAGWLLAAVTAIESRESDVILRLARPAPELALALAAPQASITPGGRPPRRDAPVGSGPFALRRMDRGQQRVVLDAAPGHFAGRPYLDGLDLRWFTGAAQEARAYELGNLHLSLRGAVAYAGHAPKYQTREVTGPATLLAYVGFGAKGALRGASGRLALSLALERDGFRGIGTGERVVPTMDPAPEALEGPALPADARLAHLEQARAAMRADAVLRTRTGPGAPGLELLVDRTRPDDRELAEKVAAALFGLGVSARIVELGAAELDARVRQGNCDLYIGQLVLPAPADEILALAAAFAAGGDDWARRTLAARTGPETTAMRKAFVRALPIVPLFHRAVRVHHRSDVRGVALDDLARLSFADMFLFGQPAASR